ncbi:hypothetical protein [Emticicia oligotrophica]|uniref:hypothetical protein n=1 Tax=Emticicia oligotrophica TaxID=312279 RepID=UPI00273C32E3|nr:hypothetical protein [Emticicia oligotrophica]
MKDINQQFIGYNDLINKVNLFDNNWCEKISKTCLEKHLLCIGSRENLQQFGTNLIQKLNFKFSAEVSSLYGKHIKNIEDFCYQLYHSTISDETFFVDGYFIRDILRDKRTAINNFFIWYDADILYQNSYDTFTMIFESFLEIGFELDQEKIHLRSIILLEESESIKIRKLIKNKEKFPIEILKIDNFSTTLK